MFSTHFQATYMYLFSLWHFFHGPLRGLRSRPTDQNSRCSALHGWSSMILTESLNDPLFSTVDFYTLGWYWCGNYFKHTVISHILGWKRPFVDFLLSPTNSVGLLILDDSREIQTVKNVGRHEMKTGLQFGLSGTFPAIANKMSLCWDFFALQVGPFALIISAPNPVMSC